MESSSSGGFRMGEPGFVLSNVVSDFIGKSHDTLADLNWSALMQVYALGWCRDVPVSMEEEEEGLGECRTRHLCICQSATLYKRNCRIKDVLN
jgi:hypothetical protein